jgi:peptide deformylase
MVDGRVAMLRKLALRRQVGGGSAGSGGGYGSASAGFPIVMMPSRSLWCQQQAVNLRDINDSSFSRMVDKLKSTRSHYRYPCLAAPQIGWNVQVFTFFDGSVWINPRIETEYRDPMCWTWEVSASQAFLVHYIERPYRVLASGYDERGRHQQQELTGMRSRLFQHCMDFMKGELYHRRVADGRHIVPMDGFHTMSEWADDYPSLEARSTNLYTIFIPPTTFLPEYLEDAALLDRQYSDGIYPGHEVFEQMMRDEREQDAQIKAFAEKLRKRDNI